MLRVPRLFRNLYNPGPYQVPTGQLAIDWTHPLSRGLIACVVPGSSWSELTGNLSTFQSDGVAAADGASPEGPGVGSVLGSKVFSTVSNANAGYAQFNNYSAISLYVRGYIFTVMNNYCAYWGIEYNNPQSSPFNIAAIELDNAGNNRVVWNSGGTQQTQGISAAAPGKLSLGTSFAVNGNVLFYQNGASVGSTAFGASGPTSSTTSFVVMGGYTQPPTGGKQTLTLGCAWNRVLTAAEFAQLDAAPYDFIVPADADLPQLAIISFGRRRLLMGVGQ